MQNQRRAFARQNTCPVRASMPNTMPSPCTAPAPVVSSPMPTPTPAPRCPMPMPRSGDCLTAAPSLAMVYGPCQSFTGLYSLDEGLKNGTIFKELNLVFRPGNNIMPRKGDCK